MMPGPHPRTRTQEVLHLCSLLARSRLAKYVLLAPTALSAIANLNDIGELAQAITRAWLPFMLQVGSTIRTLAPWISLEPRDLAGFLFFLPFAIVGIVSWWRRKQDSPPWVIAVAALTSFFALAITFTSGIGPTPVKGLISSAVFGLLLSIGYLFTRRVIKIFTRDERIVFLSLPFVVFAVFAPTYWFHLLGDWRIYGWLPILVAILLSMPLFAPARLIQVGILATIIVTTSIAHKEVAHWFSLL